MLGLQSIVHVIDAVLVPSVEALEKEALAEDGDDDIIVVLPAEVDAS